MNNKKNQCDVCGHETDILQSGTGRYANKMVCMLCEDRNMREQLLRLEISNLKDEIVKLKEENNKQGDQK